MSNQYYIIPVFVPHAGCPHDCVFCNQDKISGYERLINITKIKENIKEYYSTIKNKNAFIEIAFFGGSFTGIERKIQFELLDIAKEYVDRKLVNGIRLSTRPDYINNEILDYLKEYKVTTIELGVQSLNNEVLKLSNRGHNAQDVYKAVKLIREYDFKLGLQFMPGLPGDTVDTMLKTADGILSLKPNIVRIYPTLVVRGTYLEKLYNDGKYVPLSLSDTIDICKNMLVKFNDNGINVIRIGLQTTDNINTGKDVIAGPFHPSLRELVESEIIYDKMVKVLEKISISNKSIEIKANPLCISKIVGQKRKNIVRIRGKFNLYDIKINQDENIKKENFMLKLDDKDYKLQIIK